MCSFYRATIAPYYNPDNMDDNGLPHETVNGNCYSLWIFENDITNYHSGIASGNFYPFTAGFFNDFTDNKAVDGYSCDHSDNSYYHSGSGFASDSYFELQFPTHVQVTSVLVKTRNAPQNTAHYFYNMEMRVGNFSGLVNFGLNMKIGNTESFAGSDDFIRFDALTNPIVGLHVIIHQIIPVAGSNFIVIEEMKVIGHII